MPCVYVSDCCMKGNVSAACLPVCSESQLVNLHECGAEMGVVLECAAGGWLVLVDCCG